MFVLLTLSNKCRMVRLSRTTLQWLPSLLLQMTERFVCVPNKFLSFANGSEIRGEVPPCGVTVSHFSRFA